MRRILLHLGFLLPLLIVCASFELLKIANASTNAYEQALNKDYAMVLVANKPLELTDIELANAKQLSQLDISATLEKLQNQLSAKNIKTLKASLPHFYSLYFKNFMSDAELKAAKSTLEKHPAISKVEIFSKTHTKVYHLLLLLRAFSLIASCIIALLCWVLFMKQAKIWIHEHAERMMILELFGASFFGRCGFLLRMVLINCALTYALLVAVFLNFANFTFVREFYAALDAPLPEISPISELASICAFATVFSVLAVLWVLKKSK